MRKCMQQLLRFWTRSDALSSTPQRTEHTELWRTQKMIKTETNPYTIKSLTRKLHKSQAWMRIRNDVLKEVVELKFLSHPSLMNKLLSLQKEYFYEATLDPVYGCGYMLAQANHVTADKVKESANVMGNILQQIRDFHKPRN